MRCTKCGTEITTSRKFCAACGSPLSNRCPKCGVENAPSSAFCEDCGAALAGRAAPAATSSPQAASTAPNIRVTREQQDPSATIDGERKTVTALFADIKGSTELMEDLDPEEARAIIDPALKLTIDAAHRFDGYVVQSTGDGIFALFGAPVAHEDHPQRALHAARRMQEDLKRYADRLRERGQPPLSVRVGVNSGEVVVRSIQTGDAHTEYTPIGHSISLAARLQTLAAPGSVAIGESVRRFVEGYFQLKPLGASRIKGVSDPVNVYEVTGLGPLRTRLQRSAGRGLTKFVGRAREMTRSGTPLDWPDRGTGRSSLLWRTRGWASRGCFSSSRRSSKRDGWCWKRSRSRMARRRPTYR
jgi:class 3 adenylate cyclase